MVSENGQKVVGVPIHQLIVDEAEPILSHDFLKEQIEIEMEQQKVKAKKALEEWQQKEEERFLFQLEEEKRRGYLQGYEMGMQEGTQHAEEHYKAQLQKAADVLEQAYQEKTAVIKEAEPFVIELTTEIAKKVLQQELKINPDALIHLIKQTLATVYETSSISISVAPEDFTFVQKQREQLMAVDNGRVEVKVFPDYSIEQGGCIIRTSSGSVDARIDVQLSEIKKVLLSNQQEDARE
ncbi:MAG: flagellar assembly protein FliH [Bacillus sp. (in: firmicutes)]|nr:flagellar assembly protein FliH [Bacillus sp. (in: firmicutes)]